MINSKKKHYDLIIVYLSIIVAIVIRFLCKDAKSEDYETFLINWVKFFKENGGWRGLKHSVGDYNVVYQYILIMISYIKFYDLYLIKLVSCVFDFLMAWGCGKCVELVTGDRKKARLCFSVVLLLPTVWINSSFWGQCDSIYVAFVVWSIYFLLKNRNYLSIMFLALAFTFKLQTVFIFPLFFSEFLKKNIKIRHCLIFPVTYFITCIPALIFGKTFFEIIEIYFNQTTEYPQMVMSAPSLMQIFELVKYNNIIAKLGILAAFIFAFGFSIMASRKKDTDKRQTLSLCLIMSLGIPFFLPHMHDRYFYMAGIFSVIYAFVFGKKRAWIAILAEISSLIFYFHFFAWINLYGTKFLTHILTHANGATLMLFVFAGIILFYFVDFKNKNINFRKAGVVLLSSVLIFSAAVQAVTATRRIVSKVDGKYVNQCGITAIKTQDTIMLPLRPVFNTAGYTVSYDRKTSSVKLQSCDEVVFLSTGKGEAVKNGETLKLLHPCVIENNITFISKDDAANLLDKTVEKKGNVIYFETIDK